MINFYNQQNRDYNSQTADEVSNQIGVNNKSNGKEAPQTRGKSKLEKYVDPTNEFDSKQLKWGMWYVKNKILLYRLTISGLAVFIAATFIFSLWKGFFILYYDFYQQPRVEVEMSMAPNYEILNQSIIPQPLQIMDVRILSGGTDKNDVITEITNPNGRHIVYFDYYFDFNGQQTQRHKDFLLPLESRPMAVLGLDSNWAVGTANLAIENISWRRISAHDVADVSGWQNERLNFSIFDFVFKPAGAIDGASSNIISFKLANNSPYSFKDALFYIGLYQDSSLAGLIKLPVLDFVSLEVRDIDVRSFVSNLTITGIKIFPVIDLYDKTAYIQP